ncbi:hypothetical protein MMC29_007479 [Sticta canariensis]|nr:hypothetical protein [Sticta canariensis]
MASPTAAGCAVSLHSLSALTAPSIRKNGKHWHAQKSAFRPKAGYTSYSKRINERKAMDAMKAKEKAMKDEKEAARQRRIQTIKDRRAAKEEKARFEKMAETMHKKRHSRRHLGQTLQSLTKLSTTTTRRLDYTYYSTLEHLSVLANLTSSLATLSSTISQHQVHFSNSTSSLAQIFRTQISGFDKTFRVQAERISALETRLQEGRTRVGNLNQRLESVRVRVEGWERGEMEWQGRARRRLRMLWAGTGSMLAIFLVFLLIRHWPQGGREVAPPLTLQPPASDTTSPSLHVDDEVKNPAVASFPTTSFESRGGFSPGTSPPPHIARMSSSAIVIRKNVDYDYDALLRLFDEL